MVIDIVNEQVDETATNSLRSQMENAPSTAATSVTPAPVGNEELSDQAHTPRSTAISETISSKVDKSESLTAIRATVGDQWSFEVVYYSQRGNIAEVRGELRANHSYVAETGSAVTDHGASLGAAFQAASDMSFQRCVERLIAEKS